MTDNNKIELKSKISQSEEIVSDYQYKEREALAIGKQFQQLYRKQEELLKEVLYYSQGTVAEQSARIDVEDLEHQCREVMFHFSGKISKVENKKSALTSKKQSH